MNPNGIDRMRWSMGRTIRGVCARFIDAWTGWMLGYPDQGQTSIDDALDLAERLGHPLSLLLALVFATVTDQFRREPESAWQHLGLAETLAAAAEIGERWWEAELHRLKGLRLLARGGLEEAQAAFHDALRVAREQQAKSLELRAATSLARLWGEQGRRAEARELLAPVHGWFTEGFDTADLKDAARLLSELA